MGSWANGCVEKRIHYLLESVSYEWANRLDKRQKNWGKIRMDRSEAIKIQWEEVNRNCALRCSCADFCDRIEQCGDKELWKRQQLRYFTWVVSWVQTNGSEQDLGMHHLKEEKLADWWVAKFADFSQFDSDSLTECGLASMQHSMGPVSWAQSGGIGQDSGTR